jgi:CubicO group peptidase (beta-lactamase class C family)
MKLSGGYWNAMKKSQILSILRRTKIWKTISLILVLTFSQTTFTIESFAQSSPLNSEFDEYVEKTMLDWNAPGMIIAIVKDGKPDFVKGYGTRKYAEDLLPDNRTLFHIASHSKSLTAAAIGILVDEGKLSWDDPVQKYIQEFRFVDEYVTENTTIRDILTHRSGLPHTVGSMTDPDYDFPDLILDLKNTGPVTGFRERHSYSNVGYAIAGEIIARVSGLSHADFVAQRIFGPLGMSRSFTGATQLQSELGDLKGIENIFLPARLEKDGAYSTDWGAGFNALYDPAGGTITTADDVLRWLTMQLQEGEYFGERLLNVETVREMHRSQIVVEPLVIGSVEFDWVKLHNPFLHFITYGLGWFIYDYNGLKVLEHTGLGTNRCSISIIPQENLGIAVCTNALTSGPDAFRDIRIASALKLRIIDSYTGATEVDWSSIFFKIHEDEVAGLLLK